MDMKLFAMFVIFNIINVIIQTFKSLATINCGKGTAAIVNALAYGLYTYIVILMVCELPLWLKVLVVGGCNLIGVYIVKWIEEKSRKDKLWKVEVTIPHDEAAFYYLKDNLDNSKDPTPIPYNYIDIGKYYLFNIYCETQSDSKCVHKFLKEMPYKVKYFVTESKVL